MKYLYASWFEEIVQREVVRLGLQFQVGGKWCSFVAVSENEHMGMKPSEDDMYRVESPVQALEDSFDEASFDGAEGCASEGTECEEAEESDEDMGFGPLGSSPTRETAPVNGPDTRYFHGLMEHVEGVRPEEAAVTWVADPLHHHPRQRPAHRICRLKAVSSARLLRIRLSNLPLWDMSNPSSRQIHRQAMPRVNSVQQRRLTIPLGLVLRRP